MMRGFSRLSRHDVKPFIIALIVGYLFLNPFPHVTALKEIFLYTAIGLIVLTAIAKKGKIDLRSPFSSAFLLILAWSVICIPFAVNKTNTMHDIYAHLIKYFFVYLLMINLFDSREKFILLGWTIIFSTASFCIWSMSYFYLFLGHPVDQLLGVDVFKETPTNIIGVVTVFGILVSLLVLTLEGLTRHKMVVIFMIGLMALTMLLTQSRSALLALACVLVLLSFRHKFVMILAVILITLLIVLPIKNRLTPDAIIGKIKQDPRMKIVHTYIEVVKEYPLQGIGFGLQSYADVDFLKKYHDRVTPDKRSATMVLAPHNFFIDILVRLGIVGLALYLYLLCKATLMSTRLAMDKKNRFARNGGLILFCALVAFLIQGTFENVHSGPPAVIFYTLLAMITLLNKNQGKTLGDHAAKT